MWSLSLARLCLFTPPCFWCMLMCPESFRNPPSLFFPLSFDERGKRVEDARSKRQRVRLTTHIHTHTYTRECAPTHTLRCKNARKYIYKNILFVIHFFSLVCFIFFDDDEYFFYPDTTGCSCQLPLSNAYVLVSPPFYCGHLSVFVLPVFTILRRILRFNKIHAEVDAPFLPLTPHTPIPQTSQQMVLCPPCDT